MTFTKLMIWAAFRKSQLGSLYFEKMNAEMYIEVKNITRSQWGLLVVQSLYRDVRIVATNPVYPSPSLVSLF